MSTYFIRRILIGLLTLLAITFIIYGLIRLMPGDPLLVQMEQMDPSRKLNPADIERMRETFGLNKPIPVAYWQWLTRLVQLDLGTSLSRRLPVAQMIRERIGPTLLLSVSSLLLAYFIAIPLGLYSTVRNGRLDERIISTFLYMLYSLPIFVAALLLLIQFHLRLGWLPLGGMTSNDYASLSWSGKLWDLTVHAVLPVICNTYVSLAYYSRFIHANMQEVIRQDYIRTATAKGVSRLRVITHHAFRNTLIPLTTMVGLTVPALLSGAVILEQVFNWPGMGNLFFEAIRERDYPTIMGLTLLFSAMTLLGQLLADLMYAFVDPRVSYS